MKISNAGPNLVATPSGEIDLANATEFKDEIAAALDRSGVAHLILDLSEVRYMDSSGVRVVFHLARRLEMKRGRLAILLPGGSALEKLFKVAHVNEAAYVCTTVEECLESLGQAAGLSSVNPTADPRQEG